MEDQTLIILIGLVVGIGAFFVTLLNTNAAITMLIYSMLLSPEIPLIHLPERSVVIRFDDLLLGIVFLTWLAKLAINKELEVLRTTPLNVPMGFFILMCCVSTGWGAMNGTVPNFVTGLFYIVKYVEYFMVFFMVANTVQTREQLERFLKAAFVTAALVSLYCYWTLLATGSLFSYLRVTAPFDYSADGQGEPNTLAMYLVMILAICGGVALYTPSPSRRRVLVVLIAWMVLPLMATFSRGGYAAFLVMYVMLCLFSRRYKFLLFLLLMAGAILIPLIAPPAVVERVASTFRHPEGTLQVGGRVIPLAASPYHRVYVWKLIFDQWMKHPLLGFGITGVGLIDSQYPRIIGELGMGGFGGFVWLISSIWGMARRVFRTMEDVLAKGISLGFLAGFAALLIGNLTGNFFIVVRVMEPFWFLAAIVAVLPRVTAPPPSAVAGGPVQPFTLPRVA